MTTPDAPKSASSPPRRDALCVALGSRNAWRILEYMVHGDDSVTASEISGLLHISNSAALKQLDRMVRAGVLTRGNSRIYRMPRGARPDPQVPHLDFGHVLMRFDQTDPQ